MGEAIVFTSGKGGVGKTTTLANIGTGLSQLDKKVIMLDTDIGLRNLDIVMGLEDRIRYNLLDILQDKCKTKQALIRDYRYDNLYMISAALGQWDLSAYKDSFINLISELKQEYDYCLIDCPAGMDKGYQFSISAADRAIIVTTPHISAVRDAGRIIHSLRYNGIEKLQLIINEYDWRMIRKKEMLSQADIEELLGIKAIGVVPLDKKIISSQNYGIPVVSTKAKASSKLLDISKIICQQDMEIIYGAG